MTGQVVICPGGQVVNGSDYSGQGRPRLIHADGSMCLHPGEIRIGDAPGESGESRRAGAAPAARGAPVAQRSPGSPVPSSVPEGSDIPPGGVTPGG